MAHRRPERRLLRRVPRVHRVLHNAHRRHAVHVLPGGIAHGRGLARVRHRGRARGHVRRRRALRVCGERLRWAGHSALEVCRRWRLLMRRWVLELAGGKCLAHVGLRGKRHGAGRRRRYLPDRPVRLHGVCRGRAEALRLRGDRGRALKGGGSGHGRHGVRVGVPDGGGLHVDVDHAGLCGGGHGGQHLGVGDGGELVPGDGGVERGRVWGVGGDGRAWVGGPGGRVEGGGDVRGGAEGDGLVGEEGVGLIGARSGWRRRGGRRGVGGCGLEARIGAGFLLDGGLLVDGEELAFFAQTDTVLTAALRVVGGDQTADLSSATVYCTQLDRDRVV